VAFARQLQQDYGLAPSTGDVASFESLAHLDARRLETARILREILAHSLAPHMAPGTAASLELASPAEPDLWPADLPPRRHGETAGALRPAY